MNEPERCTRCVTPITRPGLIIDEEGVCSACRWEEQKLKDTKGMKALRSLIELYCRNWGREFDCLLTVSGGKDSTYQTYMITRELGLKAMGVTWACCQSTPEGEANLNNLIHTFNIVHVMIQPAPRDYPEQMRKGLIDDGDCCMPCHHGIFSQAAKIAKAYEIPLIIWGENPRKEYGGVVSAGEDQPLIIDGVTHLYLGDYINWDAKSQVDIIKTMGFKELSTPPHGAWLKYENVDCGFVGIHDYFAYLKFGMSRASIQLSIEIRKDRMTRDEALKILSYIEPVHRPGEEVQRFLKFSDMAMEDFLYAEKRFVSKDLETV